MSMSALIYADLWTLLLEGADVLRPLQPYMLVGTFISAFAALITVLNTARKVARDRRQVAIVARHAVTGARKRIATLPASKVTRAEVLGTLRLAAGGRGNLDTSKSGLLGQDFYQLGREVVVNLSGEDFDRLSDP
ncbi:MAG: hypothetical protein AB7P22_17465 [Vicinamibacterales bacterium]